MTPTANNVYLGNGNLCGRFAPCNYPGSIPLRLSSSLDVLCCGVKPSASGNFVVSPAMGIFLPLLSVTVPGYVIMRGSQLCQPTHRTHSSRLHTEPKQLTHWKWQTTLSNKHQVPCHSVTYIACAALTISVAMTLPGRSLCPR